MPLLTGAARLPSRAALIGILAMMAAVCSGCLVRRHKIDRGAKANAPLLTAGLQQLADSLRQHYQAIETLNATVDLEPAVLSTSKGEISEYKDVRGYILIRKPSWIRVIALYPVVRGTAFDMVSDGRNFSVYLPSKNLFIMGLNRIEKPSPRKIENLRPEHLLDALLVRPPNSSNERMVLENWTDAKEPSYIVHIIRQDGPNTLHLARNVWFDRTTLEIVRQRIFDERGDVVTDAQYSEWTRHGSVHFPKEIVITRPKDEYELRVRVQKFAFNEPIGPEKFNLPPPPGVKVERVGEAPAKPAAGTAGQGEGETVRHRDGGTVRHRDGGTVRRREGETARGRDSGTAGRRDGETSGPQRLAIPTSRPLALLPSQRLGVPPFRCLTVSASRRLAVPPSRRPAVSASAGGSTGG